MGSPQLRFGGRMPVIVIGGQARNVGKTSVICALLTALPDHSWTAIKITPHRHAGLASAGTSTAGRAFVVYEEEDPTSGSDTSRYLAAGAARSLLIWVSPGGLHQAMPRIREEIARAGHTIIESNSVLEFLQPDLYAMLVDPQGADLKSSARRYLERADALLMPPAAEELAAGQEFGSPPAGHKHGAVPSVPIFQIGPPTYLSPGFTALAAERIRKGAK
jgi:hypothetical protein